MPLKPIKRDYKVWVRTDESGYICHFEIYIGKEKDKDNSKGIGLGKGVVKCLGASLGGKGYKIFADNFLN